MTAERPDDRPTAVSRPPATVDDQRVTAFDPPREFRLHPRDRSVAYTAESGGTRQLFVMPLRPGVPIQLTASEKPITDPQWSPDGRRLAFVRDGSIWVVDADGSRLVPVSEHPAGASRPRWSPDGQSVAFVSRRRGWSQVWRIAAPIPRRGRPAAHPKPAEPVALTAAGIDVDDCSWSPDGGRIAIRASARIVAGGRPCQCWT
jgi:Tol biopolymer transport system component